MLKKMVSSLGPCAEALGISVMMVFAVGVAQLPIMIALALHYPAIRADVYSTSVQVANDPYTNASAVVWPLQNKSEREAGGFYTHGLNISGLFVLNAASFTFFVVLTMHLLDRHRASESDCSNEQEFTRQNMVLTSDPSFRTWNQAFVCATLVVHIVVFLTVCSPISIDFILSSFALLYISLCQLVQPLDNFEEELSSSSSSTTTGAASMAAQSNMLLCMIYGGTILFAMTHIVLDPYMGKTQAILLLACLDAFMLFGHLWDRIPMVQVVMNCRLLYVFMLAVFNLGFFCLWDPYMKTPFMTKL